MPKVFDSSAVLAFLYREHGADRVAADLPDGLISAVNAAEVLLKLVQNDVSRGDARLALLKTGLTIVDFTRQHAELLADLHSPLFRARGLSLGDRACMATAAHAGMAAVTADRNWSGIQGSRLKLEFIR